MRLPTCRSQTNVEERAPTNKLRVEGLAPNHRLQQEQAAWSSTSMLIVRL